MRRQTFKQRINAWSDQLVCGAALTVWGGCCCPKHHSLGYRQLTLRRVSCHFFHGMCDLLTRAFAFQCKAGQLKQYLYGTADRLNEFTPVNLAYEAQAIDDVADGQVGRCLGRLAVSN